MSPPAGEPDRVVFASRIDRWLLLLVALPFLTAGWFLLRAAEPVAAGSRLLGLLILLASAVLPLWLLVTDYTFADDELIVRSGPFRWVIPLSDIRRVSPTRSLLSAPALSTQRLLVEYGRHAALMISPRDEEGFLRELARRSGAGSDA